jgi:hypothetical protein
MGIEYRGVIVVGYDWDEVNQVYDAAGEANPDQELDLYDFCEERGLESFSPYYDADQYDCIHGLKVTGSQDYSYADIDLELVQAKVKVLKAELLNEFGVEAGVYIMAQGR